MAAAFPHDSPFSRYQAITRQADDKPGERHRAGELWNLQTVQSVFAYTPLRTQNRLRGADTKPDVAQHIVENWGTQLRLSRMQHPNVTPVWLTEQWRYVFKRNPKDVECSLAEMDRVIYSRTVGYNKDIELGYLFDQMLLTELVREAAQELQKHPEALEQIVTPELLRAYPEIIAYLWAFLAKQPLTNNLRLS